MIRTDVSLFNTLHLKLERQCKCTRPTEIIHCPMCGSTDVRVAKRASRNRTVLSPKGDEVIVRVFNCRRCAVVFAENTCFFTCTAPSVNWRREDNIAERISPVKTQLTEQSKELLRELARVRPDKANTITNRLKEDGPGLLERVERERIAPPDGVAQDLADETARLFEPPDLDDSQSD